MRARPHWRQGAAARRPGELSNNNEPDNNGGARVGGACPASERRRRRRPGQEWASDGPALRQLVCRCVFKVRRRPLASAPGQPSSLAEPAARRGRLGETRTSGSHIVITICYYDLCPVRTGAQAKAARALARQPAAGSSGGAKPLARAGRRARNKNASARTQIKGARAQADARGPAPGRKWAGPGRWVKVTRPLGRARPAARPPALPRRPPPATRPPGAALGAQRQQPNPHKRLGELPTSGPAANFALGSFWSDTVGHHRAAATCVFVCRQRELSHSAR